MPQHEFDAYLSLLSKILRLSGQQQAELSDELQDHLETRLADLIAAGRDHEEAVRLALEEFGDAAVLADRFSRLTSRQHRKFVMRCTAASAAVVAAVVFISLSLAPPGPVGPGPQPLAAQPDVAQLPVPGQGRSTPSAVPSVATVEQQAEAALDRKLDRVLTGIEFKDVPLREALQQIGQRIEADVLLESRGIKYARLPDDHSITLSLIHTQVSARTALEFMLTELGLTFVNQAGVLVVTHKDILNEILVTKVYDVSDLVGPSLPATAVLLRGMNGVYYPAYPDLMNQTSVIPQPEIQEKKSFRTIT